jgi:hypothetical protein
VTRLAQRVFDLPDPQIAEVAVHMARSARERSLRSPTTERAVRPHATRL